MIKAFRERELATMIGSKHAAQIGLAVEPLRPEEMICGYCRKSMRPGQIAWLDGIRCHASCAQTAARFFFNYLGTGTPSAAPSAPEVTPIR